MVDVVKLNIIEAWGCSVVKLDLLSVILWQMLPVIKHENMQVVFVRD